jgi:hypothetical protein
LLPPDLAVSPMTDSSFYREKAEQALRLARDSTDPVLINSLTEMAREYIARADAIDGLVLGKDPKDEDLDRLGWRPLCIWWWHHSSRRRIIRRCAVPVSPPLNRSDKTLSASAFGALIDMVHKAGLPRFRLGAGKAHL